jgi:hypothetical protein
MPSQSMQLGRQGTVFSERPVCWMLNIDLTHADGRVGQMES